MNNVLTKIAPISFIFYWKWNFK